MTWQDHIEVNQEILVGKPVIKGTRISVEHIIDLLADGWTINDILGNYPGITEADIRACLAYAGARLHSERI